MSELQFLARRRREEMAKCTAVRSPAGRRIHAQLARFYADRLRDTWAENPDTSHDDGAALSALLEEPGNVDVPSTSTLL